jgi:hypothetical protein
MNTEHLIQLIPSAPSRLCVNPSANHALLFVFHGKKARLNNLASGHK